METGDSLDVQGIAVLVCVIQNQVINLTGDQRLGAEAQGCPLTSTYASGTCAHIHTFIQNYHGLTKDTIYLR